MFLYRWKKEEKNYLLIPILNKISEVDSWFLNVLYTLPEAN